MAAEQGVRFENQDQLLKLRFLEISKLMQLLDQG